MRIKLILKVKIKKNLKMHIKDLTYFLLFVFSRPATQKKCVFPPNVEIEKNENKQELIRKEKAFTYIPEYPIILIFSF